MATIRTRLTWLASLLACGCMGGTDGDRYPSSELDGAVDVGRDGRLDTYVARDGYVPPIDGAAGDSALSGSGGAVGTGGTVGAGGAAGAGGTLGYGGTSGGAGGAGGTGGAVGAGGAGGGTGTAFWPGAYASCTSPGGDHYPGRDCLGCHKSGGAASRFPMVFGGTAYRSDGVTAAGNIEIGVRDGTKLYSVCSGANGNFWLMGTTAVNWATAETRARNANGETRMVAPVKSPGCNSCHVAGKRINSPS